MTPDLKILADKRRDLLLAEVGAWLHDMGKCSDEFLNNKNRRIKCKGHDIDPYKAILCLEDLENYNFSPKFKPVRHCETDHQYALNKILGNINCKKINLKFKFSNNDYSIGEVIYFGRPLFIGKTSDLLKKNIEPNEYLGRAHGAAHIEKEGGEDLVDQKANDVRLSSPFGYETEPLVGLTNKLKNLPFDNITNRQEFLTELNKVFESAPGDTQRPINEVDLWDWSGIVAALYKSALAGVLLGGKPQPNDLKWRLLEIRVNSEHVWGNVSNISALLARKDWITNGLDKVKELLEKTYPLGNEVYRDENGSIFVVPDIDKLLEIIESEKKLTLKELISENLGYDGEIIVTPDISLPWWGQNPDGRPDKVRDKIPPIADILLKNAYSPADASRVKKWWDGVDGNPEICTISWLRPQEYEGSLRKASNYWSEKVTATGRAENWGKNLHTTIWIDEVADSNGRICLITGKLDIAEWLKPEGHIKTLLVKPANDDPDNVIKKTPSFARLKRVWDTTKKFWDNVNSDFKETVRPISQRLKIIGELKLEMNNSFPEKNNAYEAELEGKRFTIFYDGNTDYLIIENLQNLANKMGASVKQSKSYENSAAFVKDFLTVKNLKIFESEGKRNLIGQLNVFHIENITIPYIPAIPILSEPSIFMAIIPADKALEVTNKIKEKYEKELGKVRNRLPISIGLTFCQSHTPLAAMMDVGRRMMKVSTEEEEWGLEEDSKDCDSDFELNFKKGLSMRIPVKMGDNETDDTWYPYFYVKGVPRDRSTAFEGPKGLLVHVKELKKDDILKISPSHLDFEFLDSAARRFEVSYKDGKRRENRKSNRPYYLEEFTDFEKLWPILKNKLARTQRKGLLGLIETKREEWQAKPGNAAFSAFKLFVHDVIHNANWKNGKPVEIEEIEKAAVSGKLNDIVELYMDILKDKEEQNDLEDST
ncbi:MAG: CRISPR-associated protein Csx11 [Candidatus Methanoperedens sp.]